MVRMHTQPAEPFWLDIADEIGILIIDEAAVWCYRNAYSWDHKFWENYKDHIQGLAVRDRNHPSLAMYSLENEIFFSLIKDPGLVEAWKQAASYVREVDPTRPVMYAGAPGPDTCDVLSLHYPHEYLRDNYQYPEESYWLGGQITYAGMPFAWKKDKPFFISEWGLGLQYWRDHRSLFLGEEAYADPEAWTTGDLDFAQFEVPALRCFGASGNPWIAPTCEALQKFREFYQPLAIFIREYNTRFYEHAEVTRRLEVINDTVGRRELRLTWRIERGDETLESGSDLLTLDADQSLEVPVSFALPGCNGETSLKFVADVKGPGAWSAHAEQLLQVFPKESIHLPATADIGLIDASGKTAAVLDKLGVPYKRLAPRDIAGFSGRTLIIGDEALSSEVARQAQAIADFVKAGGNVICLQQADWCDWLPVKVELDYTHNATMAFICSKHHPVLKGMEPSDLKFWSSDQVVSRRNLLKPTSGTYRAVVEAGGKNGLDWVPLLEIRHGSGRYFLCQMEIVNKIDSEPVARRLLQNMLFAAAGPSSPMRPAAAFTHSKANMGMLEATGLEFKSLDEHFQPLSLSEYSFIFIETSDAPWPELLASASAVRNYISRGGVLWFHGLSPETSPRLKELLDIDLNCYPLEPEKVITASDDTAIMGLSNFDLYLHEPYVFDRLAPYRKIAAFALRISQDLNSAGCKPLTDPAVLIKISLGTGFVLIDQVEWSTDKLDKKQTLRYISNLCINLSEKQANQGVAVDGPDIQSD